MYSSKNDFYNPILTPPEHHKISHNNNNIFHNYTNNYTNNRTINNDFCNNKNENKTNQSNGYIDKYVDEYVDKYPKMHNMNQYLSTKRLLHFPIPINYNNPEISVSKDKYYANSVKYNPSKNYYYIDNNYCNLNLNTFPPEKSQFYAPQCTTITKDYNKCPIRRNSVKLNTTINNTINNDAYSNTRGYIRYGKFLSTESNVYLNSPIWQKSVNMEGRELMRKGYKIMYDNIEKIINSTDEFLQDI